jgi:lipopolysaccharide/colanic/teichoic acid biosynthesis glycosyltransferase
MTRIVRPALEKPVCSDLRPPSGNSRQIADRYSNKACEWGGHSARQSEIYDIILAILFLSLVALPMALVAVAIKLDSPGPIFFRQPRVGLNGRIFTIWKFRTMHAEATDIDGSRLTTRYDPRVTRVGVWLRRWSIDEIPQLFNVLVGDMSVVGPRPHAIKANVAARLYGEIVPGYSHRHSVKPGITGWAQINGWRGETTTVQQIEQRVAHDMEYIRRKSFLFDMRIIISTFGKISDRKVF